MSGSEIESRPDTFRAAFFCLLFHNETEYAAKTRYGAVTVNECSDLFTNIILNRVVLINLLGSLQ
jgi:hypothetical protein